MADINILGPFILSFEGGFVNDPDDRGGATNKGVTLATWQSHGRDLDGDGFITEKDVRLIQTSDAMAILKKICWDRWKADKIKNQSVANLLVDWVWCSGIYGIKIPQRVLGVDIDGKVGNQTLTAVNKYPDQQELFRKLWREREKYLDRICESTPSNRKFRKGWQSRIEAIGWGELKMNTIPASVLKF